MSEKTSEQSLIEETPEGLEAAGFDGPDEEGHEEGRREEGS